MSLLDRVDPDLSACPRAGALITEATAMRAPVQVPPAPWRSLSLIYRPPAASSAGGAAGETAAYFIEYRFE